MWIVIAAIGTVGVWFAVWLLVWKMFSVGMQSLAVQWQPGDTMNSYEILSIIASAVSLVVPALLVAPVAQGVFHKAGAKKPWLNSVGLLSAIVFAAAVFQSLFSINERFHDLPPTGILLLFAGTLLATALIYWLMVTKLARRISAKWLYAILIGLPIIVLLAEIIYRLSLTPLL